MLTYTEKVLSDFEGFVFFLRKRYQRLRKIYKKGENYEKKCHMVVYAFPRNLSSTIGLKSGEHFTYKR